MKLNGKYRLTTGFTLMFMTALVLYMIIPFLWIYSIIIILSVGIMIQDSYFSDDGKAGMSTYILRWTTLIPVVNIIPFLFIPIQGVINPLFDDRE